MATGVAFEQDRNEFRRIVTSLNDQIDTNGKDGRGTLHKGAEAIYMRLLNALFGWRLADANPPGRSEKAIDLIGRERRIVVQVTSECTPRKMSDETIAKMNAALESGEEDPYRGGSDCAQGEVRYPNRGLLRRIDASHNHIPRAMAADWFFCAGYP